MAPETPNDAQSVEVTTDNDCTDAIAARLSQRFCVI